MVKKREPKSKYANLSLQKTPTEEAIESFASGADGGQNLSMEAEEVLDKYAKRDFKAFRVPFNEYEYNLLESAAKNTGRSKLGFIRWAFLKAAENVQD